MVTKLINNKNMDLPERLITALDNTVKSRYNAGIDYSNFHLDTDKMLLLEVVYKGRVFKSACKSSDPSTAKLQAVKGVLGSIEFYENRPARHDMLVAIGDMSTRLEHGTLPKGLAFEYRKSYGKMEKNYV